MVFGRGVARDRFADGLLLGGLLGAGALFMFVDREIPPIIVWDESRLAVNALEMYQRGWSLVTTYRFVPDLWNTKPPLMIWLMNAAMQAFGPSELALRLPAMAAALGTLAMVFAFVRHATGSRATASLALVLLATSVGFYGEHGARTADYDALLCFFTTAYLAVLFALVHQPRPGWPMLCACAALIAAATLTKTIAGVVPGIGVAAYVVLQRRPLRDFATPRIAVMLAVALMPITLFYGVREFVAPGYIHAVIYNDAIGRIAAHLELHANPPWYYLHAVFVAGLFSTGPLALLAPFAVRVANGRARQAALFALCCFGGQLFAVSIMVTKLFQYILPGLPWLAIACAIGVDALVRRVPVAAHGRMIPHKDLALPAVLLLATTVIVIAQSAAIRYDLLWQRAFYPQARYGEVLSALHKQGVRHVAVIEAGMVMAGETHYAPQLRYYTLIWQQRGMTIDQLDGVPNRAAGMTIATCDPDFVSAVLARDGTRIGQTGCAIARDAVTVHRAL